MTPTLVTGSKVRRTLRERRIESRGNSVPHPSSLRPNSSCRPSMSRARCHCRDMFRSHSTCGPVSSRRSHSSLNTATKIPTLNPFLPAKITKNHPPPQLASDTGQRASLQMEDWERERGRGEVVANWEGEKVIRVISHLDVSARTVALLAVPSPPFDSVAAGHRARSPGTPTTVSGETRRLLSRVRKIGRVQGNRDIRDMRERESIDEGKKIFEGKGSTVC